MKYEEIMINGNKEKIVVKLDESYNPDLYIEKNNNNLEDTVILKKEDLNE